MSLLKLLEARRFSIGTSMQSIEVVHCTIIACNLSERTLTSRAWQCASRGPDPSLRSPVAAPLRSWPSCGSDWRTCPSHGTRCGSTTQTASTLKTDQWLWKIKLFLINGMLCLKNCGIFNKDDFLLVAKYTLFVRNCIEDLIYVLKFILICTLLVLVWVSQRG